MRSAPNAAICRTFQTRVAADRALKGEIRPIVGDRHIVGPAAIGGQPWVGNDSPLSGPGHSGELLHQTAKLPLCAAQRVAPVLIPCERTRVFQFSRKILQLRRVRAQSVAAMPRRRADNESDRAIEHQSNAVRAFLITQIGMRPKTSRDRASHTPRDQGAHGKRALLRFAFGAQNRGDGAHPQSHIAQLPQSHYFGVNHCWPFFLTPKALGAMVRKIASPSLSRGDVMILNESSDDFCRTLGHAATGKVPTRHYC